MISTLHIKNIGIIEDLSIDLNKGLNVLTGETGAGKTLIIDSLGIICGGRFSKEMIRKGENHSYVEINIYAPEDINSVDGNTYVYMGTEDGSVYKALFSENEQLLFAQVGDIVKGTVANGVLTVERIIRLESQEDVKIEA